MNLREELKVEVDTYAARGGLIRRVGDTLVRFLRGADHQFNIDPVCGFLQEKLDDQASATNGLSLPPAPRKKP